MEFLITSTVRQPLLRRAALLLFVFLSNSAVFSLGFYIIFPAFLGLRLTLGGFACLGISMGAGSACAYLLRVLCLPLVSRRSLSGILAGTAALTAVDALILILVPSRVLVAIAPAAESCLLYITGIIFFAIAVALLFDPFFDKHLKIQAARRIASSSDPKESIADISALIVACRSRNEFQLAQNLTNSQILIAQSIVDSREA